MEGQVEGQTGWTILKNWRDKTAALMYCERGGNEPKKRVKCRKLTLFVQLLKGVLSENPCKYKGFRVL